MLIDPREQEHISDGFVDTELAILMLEDYLADEFGSICYKPFQYMVLPKVLLPIPRGYHFPEICL